MRNEQVNAVILKNNEAGPRKNKATVVVNMSHEICMAVKQNQCPLLFQVVSLGLT
jgi:hypothetical protein